MSADMYRSCEWLTESLKDRLPAPLGNLAVQGLNTPRVESLTGYLSRCADYVDLTVLDLLRHKISPLLSHQYLTPAKITGSSFNAIAAMNGRCGTSAEWVRVLGMLSHCRDLIHTNFLMFKNIIPDKQLLKSERAWCPLCLNEWRKQDRVYEPLLFNVSWVKICPVHGCWLVDRCPSCQSKSQVLAPRIVPGYCTSCGAWLGSDYASDVSPSGGSHLRVANLVGDLLAAGPTLNEEPQRDLIAKSIEFLIRTRTKERSVRGFARLLKIDHTYVLDWLNGVYVPTLGNLLRICLVFNVTLVEIVTGCFQEEVVCMPVREASMDFDVASQRPINWPTVRQTMGRMASGEEHPRRVINIARSFNCHVSALYSQEPRLCKAVTARVRERDRQRQDHEEETFVDQIREYLRKCRSEGKSPVKIEIFREFGSSKKRKEIVDRVFGEVE